jgi:hypothetical protein
MSTKNGNYKDSSRPLHIDPSQRLSDQERQRREEKIEDLLPNEDEQLGKAYDSRLVSRLMAYISP